MLLESPIELASRLRLGREEFLQRLLTSLILEAPYPRWNTRSQPSTAGVGFLRSLWELSHFGPWPGEPAAFVDEFDLPRRHDDEVGGAPDYAVLWSDRLWMIELKTEAASHRQGQLPLYFELAHHHHRDMYVDLTYLTAPLRSSYQHDGGGRFAHVLWEQVVPAVAGRWAHVDRSDVAAIRDGLLDAIGRLPSESPADYLAALRSLPAPASAPVAAAGRDELATGLLLAAETADDGQQRALDHAASSLEELQQLRKDLRDALADREAGSPLLHVRPWIWTHASGGTSMTSVGAETGAELRFSRYRKLLY